MVDVCKIGKYTDTQKALLFHCPGCDTVHQIIIDGPNKWEWNNDKENPTITPSILVTGGEFNIRCHSYITNGNIQFLGDSTHKLANNTVRLPEWPYNTVEE